jgi:hypothetical protein
MITDLTDGGNSPRLITKPLSDRQAVELLERYPGILPHLGAGRYLNGACLYSVDEPGRGESLAIPYPNLRRKPQPGATFDPNDLKQLEYAWTLLPADKMRGLTDPTFIQAVHDEARHGHFRTGFYVVHQRERPNAAGGAEFVYPDGQPARVYVTPGSARRVGYPDPCIIVEDPLTALAIDAAKPLGDSLRADVFAYQFRGLCERITRHPEGSAERLQAWDDLNDLSNVEWKGRTVWILLTNDGGGNHGLANDLHIIIRRLRTEGADVRTAMPDGSAGMSYTPADFLRDHGPLLFHGLLLGAHRRTDVQTAAEREQEEAKRKAAAKLTGGVRAATTVHLPECPNPKPIPFRMPSGEIVLQARDCEKVTCPACWRARCLLKLAIARGRMVGQEWYLTRDVPHAAKKRRDGTYSDQRGIPGKTTRKLQRSGAEWCYVLPRLRAATVNLFSTVPINDTSAPITVDDALAMLEAEMKAIDVAEWFGLAGPKTSEGRTKHLRFFRRCKAWDKNGNAERFREWCRKHGHNPEGLDKQLRKTLWERFRKEVLNPGDRVNIPLPSAPLEEVVAACEAEDMKPAVNSIREGRVAWSIRSKPFHMMMDPERDTDGKMAERTGRTEEEWRALAKDRAEKKVARLADRLNGIDPDGGHYADAFFPPLGRKATPAAEADLFSSTA